MRKILSQRLWECQKKGEFTQREVSNNCDITERSYQSYELGTHEPKISILVRIAEFYKVSIDYLVGLTDDPTPYPRKK